MDQYSAIQIFLVFAVTFIAAIDQFSFLESLYQPIVMGPVIGAILGDVQTGLIVGATYQLMTIGNMPVGGAQPPNAVIGGIMAAVFAIAAGFEPAAAVAAAVPFALLGQYAVTLIFTAMAPVMSVADKAAENADPKAIERINYLAMAALGAIFGVIVLIFFFAGATYGEELSKRIPKWFMDGMSAAGGMMRFVGFAILLKVMVSRELWPFYFAGFAIANLFGAIPALSGSAILLIAVIGFAVAIYDYQMQVKLKNNVGNTNISGGEEDGI
ncbi:PTS mannose/fructose/sorbose/N-acetylgalactosamine transporter subunit IIC [Criibacterium bergeronii]|uniref:PTS sugar transporter subunit IIC n=1 Tax=Criibacterium bergeronii TaxID=1871336 RepID=A0A1C0AG35_9FIRM|nr:PTS sugar transporter subunit IIC [Criibacterium bergeronii]MBS6062714.1 PTS sugar transporter subunit IIC [Peptostreptococcaceae bacterium]RDY21461.1 PTS sugar transporter subunit IIC [Criibacterium bergeronii]TRW28016.1 PTS sugar transporter subunit IIC [Criibacterium bergeronii]